MTIGQALKEIRISLGLTQTEMAAGVVSVSFYSKVERGIHNIGADELLHILAANNINYERFFAEFQNSNRPDENILHEIDRALQQKDGASFYNLERKIDALPESRQKKYLQLQLHLNEVYLKKTDAIPTDLKEKLKQFVFQNNGWDKNSLQIFRETIRVYNIDEVSFLVNSILAKYSDPQGMSSALQETIGAICINFLDLCYEFNHPELTERIIRYLKKLPIKNSLLLIKLLTNYYQAIFAKDRESAKKIFEVLDNAGWHDFVNTLPKL
ncbi:MULTISPECIES: helix-turn-helix domain-containing protein [Lactobacillus]|uniref:XRE family transcriptional regulator n=1 Tax=Lactobacillus xujianguonis TaxID=2495899 RepID=A0A437SXL2_9LACO|nr:MULTISPECIES: helix-turn-helix transcriptional regulator [Lactobacillus]RVU71610.1 XRE family transcriptional regulator [Lactobacillus xujianguonis]RVU77739.1 XRE family transcriptional regulator [Lactobacillus xujianguonis]